MKSGRISGANRQEIKTIETTSLINQLQCEISIIHTIDFYDLERETRYQHIVIKDDLKYRLQYSASNLDTLQRITRNKAILPTMTGVLIFI